MRIVSLYWPAAGGAPFPTELEARLAVRAIARAAGPHLLVYGLQPIGALVVVLDPPPMALWAVDAAVRESARSRLGPSARRPVRSGVDLDRLLDLAVDTVDGAHPVLAAGSWLPDAIGTRVLPNNGVVGNLRLARSGFAVTPHLARLGVAPIAPACDAVLAGLGARRLARAAGAALAVDLYDTAAPARLARSAVADLARRVGVPSHEVAEVLGTTVRSVNRLSAAAATPEWLQIAIRTRVAAEVEVSRALRRAA